MRCVNNLSCKKNSLRYPLLIMAQYKTHATFNCFIFPILLTLLIYFFHPKNHCIFTFSLSFFYGTFFMNPDLDIANKIKLFSLRGVLSIPFRSYSYVFRHRGISHSIFFGTLTRLIWLALFILAMIYIIYQKGVDQKDLIGFYQRYKTLLFYIFIGLFLADICHLFLDKRILIQFFLELVWE